MIILSLASKQIWPQVLVVSHLRPEKIFLLHSSDYNESKGPAQRLKRFFDESGLIPKGGTKMEEISDADFHSVESALGQIQTSHALALENCVVNFTGGNKLMATAAFRWAARHAKACYLERRNQLTWFHAPDGQMITTTEPIDTKINNDICPVELLRCQIDSSEIERKGQKLFLNDKGKNLSDEDIQRIIINGSDPIAYLRVEGEADAFKNKGDILEYLAALVLLHQGVLQVQRSLRLKVKSAKGVGTRLPHAEIDLLFNWNGRLWLVDCKDRKPESDLIDGLIALLPTLLKSNGEINMLLKRIGDELSIGQTKVLKEDLLAIRETGGLLGNIICIRKSPMTEEVEQFARHNKIEVIMKGDILNKIKTILYPDRHALPLEIDQLAVHFNKK